MTWLADPESWIALLTLTALEIVLGVDNIMLIAVLTGRLPEAMQPKARRVGLFLAMGMRILLLLSLAALLQLTNPWFALLGHGFSGRDLILLGGGLFLLAKGTHEIHTHIEGDEEGEQARAARASFGAVLAQIAVLDIVFSLDSVITAVGMAESIPVMIAAIILAVLAMMIIAGPIAKIVKTHPTVRMLALSFLLLVGVALVADGLGHHIPRGYVYFALCFSSAVEVLNMKARKKRMQTMETPPLG
jgi:predicted tellurium resistance membrane protein TerC